MSREPVRVVILGAGPAGLGAAYALSRRDGFSVTVLERNLHVGGNAGSFELEGVHVDFGSHRLHPSCDARIMADIGAFLGEDLLDRPRHGRIRLHGRWIGFPLKPLDLMLRLPPTFAAGVVKDMLLKPIRARSGDGEDESFASILSTQLGPTIARDFYLPYARKIWGGRPEDLSPVQARRRVSANSPLKLLRKILGSVPGLRRPGAGRFYYPRRGFGQISEAYRHEAEKAGARVELGATVTRLAFDQGTSSHVHFERDGRPERLSADWVWSTIPITVLARCVDPGPGADVLRASEETQYRAMMLVYLVLDQQQYTEFDAHYFPEQDFPVTRISEPKNYSDSSEPRGRTVLCAEIPCATTDPEWSMPDGDLGKLVGACLERAGLPSPPVSGVVTRRLSHAYPIYPRGYEDAFTRLDAWASGLEKVLSFGRQGLFAHDNTHHALFMAYCAAECLGADGAFDRQRWKGFRDVFATHVVED